jgi:hypothetical protein
LYIYIGCKSKGAYIGISDNKEKICWYQRLRGPGLSNHTI